MKRANITAAELLKIGKPLKDWQLIFPSTHSNSLVQIFELMAEGHTCGGVNLYMLATLPLPFSN